MTSFVIDERSIKALGFPDLLAHLSQRCKTDQGRLRASHLPLLEKRQEVERELDLVAEARACHDRGSPLPFGAIWDLRPALKRLEKEGALDGLTLLQVSETLKSCSRLRRYLQSPPYKIKLLGKLGAKLTDFDDIATIISESFDEHGKLVDNASPELGQLRARLRDLHEQLSQCMRRIMDEPQIAKYLQDRFYTQREDRYVLPIRSDAGSAVQGIVHGSSASGATLFIEPPESVRLNNEMKVAEMAVLREEMRIIIELSTMVGEERQAIHTNLDVMEQLDVINARAILAIDLNAHRPRISDDGRVELLNMQHPLMLLRQKQVIANDLKIEPSQVLILTGPNAGGKTVCLKTLGLAALMLRAGMHLSAGPDSRLPLYDVVLTEMGDDQSIDHNLSTFTAHLRHLLDFLAQARPNSLILLDEIGIGTDPIEGAALGQTLLEAYAETRAQVVATTHYERLKSLPFTDPRFANASVGFDLENMRPTYRLNMGTPGSSGALVVAKRLGLSPEMAKRAASLMGQNEKQLTQLLTALAGEKARLELQHEELEKATAEAHALAEEHREALSRVKEKERQLMHEAFNEAVLELRQARDQLKQVKALLRRTPTQERHKQADRQVSSLAQKILKHEPQMESLPGRPAEASDLTIGTTVFVKKLGGKGEVALLPRRNKVLVAVGGIRTQINIDEVRILDAPSRSKKNSEGFNKLTPNEDEMPPSEVPANSAPPADNYNAKVPLRTAGNTIDLRGMRVDEALSEIEKFLDQALRAEEYAVLVIHGHGTGALRSALREHLKGLAFISRFQAAPPESGGDGVTVIWLK